MPKVEVYGRTPYDYRVLDLQSGSSLSDTENIFPFGCKAAACGRCKVRVFSGMENVSVIGFKENRALKVFGKGEPKMRLACQLKVYGDCQIAIGGSANERCIGS